MTNIETERLILRHWLPEDLIPFTLINQDPHVMEFMLKPLTNEETEQFMKKIMQHFQNTGYGLFACTVKDNNEFIGYVGLKKVDFEAHFTPNVGIEWRLAHQHWGKGYATEAAKAILAKGFEKWHLSEIVSFTVPNNLRSRRIMEKLGMTHSPADNFQHPMLPPEHPSSLHVLYRMTKDQYEGTSKHT